MKLKRPTDGSCQRLEFRRCTCVYIVAIVLAAESLVSACRYNVRDTGFVDQGNSQYLATVFGTAEELATISEIAEKIAGESNLVFQPGDGSTGLQVGPSIQFRSPDDRQLQLSTSDETSLQEWVSSLVDSPLRADLIDQLLNCHSVILIVEGQDDGLNQRARTIAKETIEAVQESSAMWPKPIDRPAELLVLMAKDREKEKISLWSWAMDSSGGDTHIAILFGRGRRLGPLLTVDEAADGKLHQLLTVVSMDCECEYDIAPLFGAMMPHRWTESQETTAVGLLGFDPGHPLVQSEVRHILQRGAGRGGGGDHILPLTSDEPLLGYQEILLPELPTSNTGPETSIHNASTSSETSSETEDNNPTPSDIPGPNLEAIAPPPSDGELTEPAYIEWEMSDDEIPQEAISTTGIWLAMGIVAAVAIAGFGWILLRGGH